MTQQPTIPVVGFVAFSGSGKTTLLEKLLPLLTQGGIRVGVVKHAHHNFDIDQPGKDSYRLRHAGASQMLIASDQRWALMHENRYQEEPQLSKLLPHMAQGTLDIILVEGFKHEHIPKIELHRPSLGHPLLFPNDDTIIAIATDGPLSQDTHLPQLNINNVEEVANFLLVRFLDRIE